MAFKKSAAGKGDGNRSVPSNFRKGMDKVNFHKPQFTQEGEIRRLHWDTYSWAMNMTNGKFVRYGSTIKEDPDYSPLGPEILDIEISSGQCSGNCSFCYKMNGSAVEETINMTAAQYETIMRKMPENLTQVALGICDVDTNPDFIQILEITRKFNRVPNYTCNGLKLTDEIVAATVKNCGAVAVSLVNEEKTLQAIQRFGEAGMKQVNVHYMLSEETYSKAFSFVDKLKTDKRTKDYINAIVFLAYKPKNPEAPFHTLTDAQKYNNIIKHCEEHELACGFDSCSAPMFLKAYHGNALQKKMVELFVDSCESGLFSSYINCKGEFYPCSFMEGEGDWKEGLDVLNCNDFIFDIWKNLKTTKWRNTLLASEAKDKCGSSVSCRECPHYKMM